VNELFENGTGTELHIAPLLSGIRQLHGEKIQNYLASELRDRISKSGVEIRIVDKSARKEFVVEPRKFSGRLIHNLPLPVNPHGEIYCELYINDPSSENKIGLYRHGTRVISDITSLDAFSSAPWNSDLLEGIIDVSFLQLTPGTRSGIVLDDVFESLIVSLDSISEDISQVVAAQKRAEEETASKSILRRISKAMKEALNFLPAEEYGWLDVQGKIKARVVTPRADGTLHGTEGDAPPRQETGEGGEAEAASGEDASGPEGTESIIMPEYVSDNREEKEFFDFPGPLHSAVISPSSTVMAVKTAKTFQLKARDRKRVAIEDGISVKWALKEGLGSITSTSGEIIDFTAYGEPGVEELVAYVTEKDRTILCTAVITITGELFGEHSEGSDLKKGRRGLPGYTYNHCPGELWRSKYDSERGIIIINSGHADFLFASKNNPRKLRYITKLYAKELVLVNFPEADREKLLERMIELQLYAEENL
jgi:hypothetical protein